MKMNTKQKPAKAGFFINVFSSKKLHQTEIFDDFKIEFFEIRAQSQIITLHHFQPVVRKS